MSDQSETSYYDGYFPTWCPGCGNFGIWAALKSAFTSLGFNREEVVVVYGIGCSGNMNDFLWVNSFHALHGRSVPNAVGIKIANHKLSVVVVAGDGDCYGEGGNHLIHAARGNHDITVVVHDNRVYGLTTGQVAPTALKGARSKSTPDGTIERPLNPLALTLTQGATFVAQGFAGDVKHLSLLIEKGIRHRGFSLINIFQPCVTFNKTTTYSWYRERVYKLEETDYDFSNMKTALKKCFELDKKIPVGVIFKKECPVYTDYLPQLQTEVLVNSNLEINMEKFIAEFI